MNSGAAFANPIGRDDALTLIAQLGSTVWPISASSMDRAA